MQIKSAKYSEIKAGFPGETSETPESSGLHPKAPELQRLSVSEDFCPRCSNRNLSIGAGLKPGQISLRCSECKAFVGYRNLEKLHKLRKRKKLTLCLELLEKQGLTGDAAIFTLSNLGGES